MAQDSIRFEVGVRSTRYVYGGDHLVIPVLPALWKMGHKEVVKGGPCFVVGSSDCFTDGNAGENPVGEVVGEATYWAIWRGHHFDSVEPCIARKDAA